LTVTISGNSQKLSIYKSRLTLTHTSAFSS